MHKLMLKFFDVLRQFTDFIKLVVVLNIMLFLLYWIEHLISANWHWLDFIRPFFKSILDFSSSICDSSFYLFKALFEVKYFISLLIFVIAVYILKSAIDGIYEIERIYGNTRIAVIKANEKQINDKLYQEQKKQEEHLNYYIVIIYTQLKKKASHTELSIDLEEQNKLMNDFIKKETGTEYVQFERGFMYQFRDYNNIDKILDILFKVIHSEAPLDYAICIQIEKDLRKLNKLVDLKQFGKITIAADTAYRYNFNTSHRYKTLPVGIFQNDNGTMEIHEFKENL